MEYLNPGGPQDARFIPDDETDEDAEDSENESEDDEE